MFCLLTAVATDLRPGVRSDVVGGVEGGRLVLLVDDHPVVRRGLVALLAAQPWVRATREASSVAEAVAAATSSPPDVAVVDLGLPDGNGLDLIGRLARIAPHCRVLVLTMNSDAGHVRAALEAGAHGFLVKETDPELVVDSVKTVAGGGTVIGPHLDRFDLVGADAREPAVAAPFDRLTARELQLVRNLAAGRSNAEIARRLDVSEKTVRNQVALVTAKIGVADRVQAALLARDRGIEPAR